MSEEGKKVSEDIFDEPTNELVDLNSSQETNSEVQILDGAGEVDKNDNEVKVIEEEAMHRLRPVPAPAERYVRESRLNPEIHLDRNLIPVVRLDRAEVANYLKAIKAKKAKKDKRCQAQIDQDALKKALDRQASLRVMARVAKAEEKAKATQRSKKGKYPKDVRKIVKKSSLTKAERSLAPPVASLHPEVPRTSTPKRIALEDLREGLRHCTQHSSSFYNRNGQPPLDPGTWPDHLSWNQARKALHRQVKNAEGHPSLLEQIERPSVYDSGAEEEEVKLPTPEEIFDSIENPIPSTSRGVKTKVVKKVNTDKFHSLTSCGKNLFIRGADFDGAIEATLDKLRSQTAMKYALKSSTINAKAAFLARQGVKEDLEKSKDQLVYLIGKRRRLLDILVAQQEMAEESLSRGNEPTLAQLGLTIEAMEDSSDVAKVINETLDLEEDLEGDLEEEVQVIEPETEIGEPEPELDHSHVSSNLSEPGMCDPQNPCQDDPCRHMGNE